MIGSEAWARIRAVFEADHLREVVVAVWTDETYQVFANIHPEPTEHFRVSIADEQKIARRYERGELLAFLHSHPNGNPSPSDNDYRSQLGRARGRGLGWTYGIVAVRNAGSILLGVDYPEFWGDAVDRGPLVGRTYLWGIRDCYALVRDYYREQGILVPDAPRFRDPLIYPEGSVQRRYFRHWAELVGFQEIPERALREPGDAYTFTTHGEEPSHCGIYLGEGRYLHHATDRTSEITRPADAEDRWLGQYRARFWRLKTA